MRLRLLTILSAAALTSACSFSGIGESVADPEPDQNDLLVAYSQIRPVFAGFKLPGNPETSSIHRVRGGYLAEWSICVRNDDPNAQRYYTFYFKNKRIFEWRLSAIIEACETETFKPLPPQ